jgi:hypothetical protein
MGSHHVNVAGNLYKRRLNKNGQMIEELKHVIELIASLI